MNDLLVPVLTAALATLVILTAVLGLKLRRTKTELESERQLGYNIITALTDVAYGLVDDVTEARNQVDRLRRDLNLSRASVHDLEANNRYYRRTLTNVNRMVSMLVDELDKPLPPVDADDEETAIAYARQVLGATDITAETE